MKSVKFLIQVMLTLIFVGPINVWANDSPKSGLAAALVKIRRSPLGHQNSPAESELSMISKTLNEGLLGNASISAMVSDRTDFRKTVIRIYLGMATPDQERTVSAQIIGQLSRSGSQTSLHLPSGFSKKTANLYFSKPLTPRVCIHDGGDCRHFAPLSKLYFIEAAAGHKQTISIQKPAKPGDSKLIEIVSYPKTDPGKEALPNLVTRLNPSTLELESFEQGQVINLRRTQAARGKNTYKGQINFPNASKQDDLAGTLSREVAISTVDGDQILTIVAVPNSPKLEYKKATNALKNSPSVDLIITTKFDVFTRKISLDDGKTATIELIPDVSPTLFTAPPIR